MDTTQTNSDGTVFCVYEDRADCEVGVRIAIASLQRQHPTAQVVVFSPTPSPALRAWCEGRAGVEVVQSAPDAPRGWDCKSYFLLQLLDRGAPEVVWIDSDIVVTGDFLDWKRCVARGALFMAEEPRHLPGAGTRNRALAWRLEPGRERGFTANGCVVGVTQRHRDLLARWGELLKREEYRQSQQQEMLDRPLYLTSDQDALGALIGSARFAALKVAYLRSGREVVHSGGLRMDTLSDRLPRFLRPGPLFVHAIATKPWQLLGTTLGDGNFDWWLLRLAQEVSEYVAHAREFRAEIGMPCPWLDHATPTGLLLRALGLGHDGLRGLPLALAVSTAQALGLNRRRST